MEESVDLHEEAGKENEQMLANLCSAAEARAKMKSKLRNFGRSRNKKKLNTRLRAFWTHGRNFVSHWKSLQQLKTYLPMSSTFFCPNFSSPFVNKIINISEATARNVCYPESWARRIGSFRRKPSGYLHYNTTKCLHSPTNPASGNFAGVHIDKFEGYTFNINVFCGDQSRIARLNENWSLSDRGTNRHYLHCNCTFGHFS